MAIELSSTNASAIASALLAERRKAGSPTMGMVMTLLVVMEEGDHYDALKVARAVSREHPARILGIIRRSAKGRPELDAELSVGASGESVLLRLRGEVTKHADSVILPLLLPDSPVVVWWPNKAPDDTANDSLGRLAGRRITDSAAVDRGKTQAILTQARAYAPGNTDLAWTRLTPWRALLAAAMDQYPARIHSGGVAAEKTNPSADLLVAWLSIRLGVAIERSVTKGPGITAVELHTGGGPIEICRPDGALAQFTIPNAPNRPVALKRRETPELLAEELRRLDPDEIYAETVERLCELADKTLRKKPRRGRELPRRTGAGGAPSRVPSVDAGPTSAAALAKATRPSSGRQTRTSKVSAAKATTKKASTKKTSTAKASTAKKTSTAKATTKKASTKKTGTAKASTAKKTTAKRATAKTGSASRKSTSTRAGTRAR